MAARFPWARLTPSAERAVTEATGVPVGFGALDLAWGTLGFALVATDVRLGWPPGRDTAFESVAARPAFSWSWLSGEPRLRVVTRGGPGDFDGVAGPGSVAGTLEVVEAGELPWTIEPLVTGAFTGNIELAFTPGQVRGGLELSGVDGSLLPPGLPIAIPFDRLTGTLRLTETGLVLDPVVIEGPLAAGRVTGTIDPPAGRWDLARLDLVAELDYFDPALGALLSPYGMDLRNGSRLTIQGTAAKPRLR